MALAASILCGCKSTFTVENYRAPASRIRPDHGVFIVVPPDAFDEPGSGRLCAVTLEEALLRHAKRVELARGVAPLSVHLTNAAAQGFTYVLDTRIHHWEEEPTEWTGKPDFLDLTLRLLQTPDGEIVTEAKFFARSKWASFGGDHVEHLLKPFADEWARAIYEGTEFKTPSPDKQKKKAPPEKPQRY
ncbi:MAG: DUF4823 domain-containing protein [Verrucomicrobiota bacterium]